MRINEVIIDNVNGSGSVPWNQEIDYRGLRVMMKPSTFLKLTPDMSDNSEALNHYEKFKEYIKKGGSIGAPWLNIEIPDDWLDFAEVTGHEGRHRMQFILQLEGDAPIETHLFFSNFRNRDIKPEWIKQLNTRLKSQSGVFLYGPFFKVMA